MVSLTRQAAEKVRNDKEGRKYLRVFSSDNSHPSQYSFAFTDTVNRDDILYMSYGIKILVDSKTRKMFENLKIGYYGENGNGTFLFESQEPFIVEM